MSGETLVEKLDEEVCCRVCHPDGTFLENVNCKSCVSSFLLPNCLHLWQDVLSKILSRARGSFFAGFNSAFLSHVLSSFGCRKLDYFYPFFLLMSSALYSRSEIMRVKLPVR